MCLISNKLLAVKSLPVEQGVGGQEGCQRERAVLPSAFQIAAHLHPQDRLLCGAERGLTSADSGFGSWVTSLTLPPEL